jgi:hypothetical protein
LNIEYFRLEITTNGLKLFPVETVPTIFSKWKLKYLCDTKHNYDSFSDCNILPEINPLGKKVILHIHIYLNVRSEELNCLVIKVFDLNLRYVKMPVRCFRNDLLS